MLRFAFVLLHAYAVHAQVADAPAKPVADIPVNTTEGLVGEYTLPELLKLENGKLVKDAKTWQRDRRPEIVKLYERNQFGRAPGRPSKMTFDVFDKGTPVFDGKAIRKQVTVLFMGEKDGPKMDLAIYVPANASKPVPVLLNIGFSANSSTVDDPGLKPGEIWSREKKRVPVPAGRPFGRINVPRIIEAGFGFATVYYGDIDPDFDGGMEFGVRKAFLQLGQDKPANDEWGTIAAWGWGLSRAIDYMETDKAIDAKRVAIMGVSRLGKTVMWAGARDERVALVVASCSGEGGAALSRRNYGETIKHLAVRYGYQFTPNYANWGDRVKDFPVDAHMLVALIAPRPVLLQTGNTDRWSDPKGEFLAAVAAEPVYHLFGKKGLETTTFPEAGKPILNDIGYYMHDGGHGMIPSDWDIILQFMTKHLKP